MKVEEEYTDVLQNIEFAIIQEYRGDPSVLDVDAADAVNALIRRYDAGRGGPPLGNRAQKIFDSVRQTCEWRLGRGPGPAPDDDDGSEPQEDYEPLTVDIIVACLRRIHSSIHFWTKEGGRQGYLSFVNAHIV